MAIYRNISLGFWTDSKVDDDFTPEDKYFYLYLLTNPHTNICGCYEVSMKQMCRESGYNEDTVCRLLDRMEHQHGVVRYCPQTKEVLVVNWAKYNWTRSEKMLSGVLDAAQFIKYRDFRLFIAEKLIAFGINADTLSIGYSYPMETSVTVTVSDTVSDTVSGEEQEEESIKKENARARTREGKKANREDEKEAVNQFTGELREAVSEWLIYKQEKRQSYQEQGLKALITRIKTYAEKHGSSEVAAVIRDSMSSNYTGIVFDRLDKKSGGGRGGGRVASYDYSDTEGSI